MIKGKTIIIVGASGGIGSVVARRFAQLGANVVLSARNEEKLLDLAESIGSKEILVAPGDASQTSDVENLLEKCIEKFGSVDAVLIAAGTWKQLSVDESVEEAKDLALKHFDALFLPSFIVGYVAQRVMRKQGHGLIANISSHAAIKPELKGNLTYGPMKSASHHYMHALRHELVGTGVRVTDIAPAIVNTPDAASLLDTDEKRSKAVQPIAIAEWLVDNFSNSDIPETALFESPVIL